jgi:hypothetical protein
LAREEFATSEGVLRGGKCFGFGLVVHCSINLHCGFLLLPDLAKLVHELVKTQVRSEPSYNALDFVKLGIVAAEKKFPYVGFRPRLANAEECQSFHVTLGCTWVGVAPP